MTTPLIGLSSSELRRAERAPVVAQSEPPRRELALGLVYPEAITRAGGLPVILAPLELEQAAELLSRLDGLCLTGGPDLHPSTYGGEDHPELGPTEPELDAFEIALARAALALDMPVLGICRGAQLLNVACGGTLLQHVPDHVGDSITHRQAEIGRAPTHAVRVRRSSRLAALLGRDEIETNSFHHQAVDRLGAGLVASAWAPDGLPEGIEAPDQRFTVGVQWHAEAMTDHHEQARLFDGFIQAARAYASPRARALKLAA